MNFTGGGRSVALRRTHAPTTLFRKSKNSAFRPIISAMEPWTNMLTKLLCALQVGATTPAQSQRARGALRQIVELPRVRRSLNLRLDLPLWIGQIEVIQSTSGASRVS